MSSSNGDALLAVEDVHKHFGGLAAVAGASFSIAPGTVTALIGPNGAGKSTLFNAITGFVAPDAGAIRFDGDSVFGAAPHVIARRGLVRTFQLTKTFAVMTVLDNMLVATRDHPGERLPRLLLRPRSSRGHERATLRRARELLELFSLDHLADAYAGTLSGGQRKLLELARALMAEPRLLLLDEPLAGINPTLGERLMGHILDLRDQGITILYVEHNMEAVMKHSERVIVMAEGRVIADGPPDVVRRDPKVLDAYLGGTA